MKNRYFDGKIISAKEANDMMMEKRKFGGVYPSQKELIAFYESKKEFFDYVSSGIVAGAKVGNTGVLVESLDEVFDDIDVLLMVIAFYRDLGFEVGLKRNEKETTLSISWEIDYNF